MNALYKYFTTPIYYANGQPHAGHIYTTILAGILKRHYFTRNYQIKVLTGLDEHGESVQEKAKENNISPQELVNEMSIKWKEIFKNFEIPYDIFLRTTDKSHTQNVQNILNHCYKKDDIYFGEHEGYYCIKCEGFLNSTEMDENKNCIIHKRPVELRKEGNYFFRTKKYFSEIKKLIENDEITQQERFKNELLSLLKNFDGDLSISRPKTRLNWGIELPFDSQHVAYVWFDALPNYVTGIGGFEAAKNDVYWKNVVHIIGKDILKFHGIIWPAMCLSLEIPIPKLLVHGWILKDGHKMSKSLGNVFSTDQILNYGTEMFSNYIYRVTNPGEDIDFSWKSYFERYNSDLANGIGNLVSRTLTMVQKYFNGKITQYNVESSQKEFEDISSQMKECILKFNQAFDDNLFANSFLELDKILKLADGHISDKKPWKLAKNNDAESLTQLSNVLSISISLIKTYAYLAYAFFPNKMLAVLNSIGESTENICDFNKKSENFFKVNHNFQITEIPKLFVRLDIAKELESIEKENKTEMNDKITTNVPLDETKKFITIDDFSKIKLIVGTVIKSEFVDGSDKLLKLDVLINETTTKQIFSGIRQFVKPEEIVNRKVLVVANLQPRKMKFGISEGMLLTAEDPSGKISPVYLSEDLLDGSLLV